MQTLRQVLHSELLDQPPHAGPLRREGVQMSDLREGVQDFRRSENSSQKSRIRRRQIHALL